MAAMIANQTNAIIALVLSSSLAPPSIPKPDALKGIDDLIRAGFEAYRATCFNWLLAATGLVVAGLVLESPELWHDITSIFCHWRFKRTFHFSLPEERPPNWAKLLAAIGWLMIVVGVAGEFVADSFVSKADGFVQHFDEILLASATREAGDAAKSAAKLEKEAEDESTARVKIEASVAWRHLNDRQRIDVASKLGNFPPNSEEATFWYISGDIEAATFAVDLAETIKLTNVVVQQPAGFMAMFAPGKFPEPGVSVRSTTDVASRKLACRLVKQLNARGFDTVFSKDPPSTGPWATPRIEVYAYPRPRGPQGEYKLQAEAEKKAKKQSTNTSNH